MTPERFWAQVRTFAAYHYEVERRGWRLHPDVVHWTVEAAASIAEDEDHLRGLIKRHCLR